MKVDTDDIRFAYRSDTVLDGTDIGESSLQGLARKMRFVQRPILSDGHPCEPIASDRHSRF